MCVRRSVCVFVWPRVCSLHACSHMRPFAFINGSAGPLCVWTGLVFQVAHSLPVSVQPGHFFNTVSQPASPHTFNWHGRAHTCTHTHTHTRRTHTYTSMHSYTSTPHVHPHTHTHTPTHTQSTPYGHTLSIHTHTHAHTHTPFTQSHTHPSHNHTHTPYTQSHTHTPHKNTHIQTHTPSTILLGAYN